MELTLSYQYYLKAKAVYPWCLDEVAESLNYALAYDNECAPALCLFARIQMEQLKNFESADEFFNRALIANPYYVDTYKYYSLLLIWLGQLDKAEKLLDKADNIKGMATMITLQRRIALEEVRGNIGKALKFVKQGMLLSPTNDYFEIFAAEQKRLKRKVAKKSRIHKVKIKSDKQD